MGKRKQVQLVFVGMRFYSESATVLSSMYEAKTWKRWDYGMLERALEEGQDVCLRQPTESELKKTNAMLQKLFDSYGKRHGS